MHLLSSSKTLSNNQIATATGLSKAVQMVSILILIFLHSQEDRVLIAFFHFLLKSLLKRLFTIPLASTQLTVVDEGTS